jgi:hypothetical protein
MLHEFFSAKNSGSANSGNNAAINRNAWRRPAGRTVWRWRRRWRLCIEQQHASRNAEQQKENYNFSGTRHNKMICGFLNR